MLTIELSNLQFHSFHGVYEEETKTGGNYEVDFIVHIKETSLPVQHINETIDYTLFYDIIKQHMEKPTPLLETIVTKIAQQVLNAFPKVEEVSVKIKKLNAPIPFFNGKVAASYNLKRTDF